MVLGVVVVGGSDCAVVICVDVIFGFGLLLAGSSMQPLLMVVPPVNTLGSIISTYAWNAAIDSSDFLDILPALKY